jgi:hypothetical protein
VQSKEIELVQALIHFCSYLAEMAGQSDPSLSIFSAPEVQIMLLFPPLIPPLGFTITSVFIEEVARFLLLIFMHRWSSLRRMR